LWKGGVCSRTKEERWLLRGGDVRLGMAVDTQPIFLRPKLARV
jgi:hypothetical protein